MHASVGCLEFALPAHLQIRGKEMALFIVKQSFKTCLKNVILPRKPVWCERHWHVTVPFVRVKWYFENLCIVSPLYGTQKTYIHRQYLHIMTHLQC